MSAKEVNSRHAHFLIVDEDEDEDRSLSADFSIDLPPSEHSPLYQETLQKLELSQEVSLWETIPGGSPSLSTAAPDFHPQEGAVPRFRVNLDAPVASRWNDVIDHFRDVLVASDLAISQFLQTEVGKVKGLLLESLASGILRSYNAMGGVYYGSELAAISRRSGIALGRLIMIQLVYEVSAACTSVVHPMHGVPLLARNMDWQLPGLDLHALTCQLDFFKADQLVFQAASWAGCVGIFTGSKPGPSGFAISVNFRIAGGTLWQNLKKGIGRGWPISFLVRETLESAPNFQTAVAWLSNSPVMAPTYLTIAGSLPGQGVVVTRDRSGEVQSIRQSLGNLPSCIQTNIDHGCEDEDADIFWSIRRRRRASFLLESLSPETASYRDIWNMLRTDPIRNELTVYSVLMCPSSGLFEVRLPIYH